MPGADGTPTGPRGRLWGTKPLCTSRRHKERLTRDFGTALDGPLRGELEEMPVDHGQEGLKLAARLIRGPPSTSCGRTPSRWAFRISRRMAQAYVRQSSGVCNGEGQQTWTRG